ncbi:MULTISPECIES: transposase [Streptomyces]|nr:transposase [Streptomyces griseus]
MVEIMTVPSETSDAAHDQPVTTTLRLPSGARLSVLAGALREVRRHQLYGHVKKTKNRSKFLEFCRYLRSLHPADVRIAIVCDNYSPHLTTKRCQRVGTWAAANNVEIACTPTNSSWLNRIEAQFTALRYFALDGTDHASHKAQGSMIRRYIIWRNKHAEDKRLRELVTRANVA